LADGRIIRTSRRARKSAAGYDLTRLFVGSEGTLGIITAAVLKLFPKPRTSATAFAAIADVGAAVALLSELRQALGDRLTGFELISAECIAVTRRAFPAMPDPLPGHAWYVLVHADDPAAQSALSEQLQGALAEAIERGTARDATIARSESQAAELWALRESIPDAQRRAGHNIKHDISLPVSSIPAFLTQAKRALDAALPGVGYVTFGHLGDGNLHYNLVPAPDGQGDAFAAATAQANRIVYDLVARCGGSFSAEHGIGQLKRDELVRYRQPVEIDLMQRIKRALDPDGLLNPGKVL